MMVMKIWKLLLLVDLIQAKWDKKKIKLRD